jgi:tetratricopeptide (TPR) repeat protein/predicted Ser/Thr protein kinase
MVCPQCGQRLPVSVGRCSACGATVGQPTLAVVAIDTTGLPPGATFGASTFSGTGDVAVDPDGTFVTMGAAPTIGDTVAAGERTPGGPLHVGQSFSPRYHIIKVLGVGGMGAVYQAWDSELEVAVALKVIRTDPRRRKVSSEAEKAFKQELLLARQVTHKNVVRIHDLGEIAGIKYITMPYIQGDDLATVIRRDGKLPIARALRLARQVAEGMVAAHEAGVVHRDLKPANVMIGAEDIALIMDFGISASADEAASGGIIGTLEYMAPEQGTGGAVDSRADIYALGMILHEMLAGPRPATATTPRERIDAMKQRTTEGLPPVRSLDESIPAALDAVVSRCLERDPAARYQTSSELVAALDLLDQHGELIPVKRVVDMRLLAAVVLLAIGVVGGLSWYARTLVPVAPHDPVSVVIADFQNLTADPAFDRTLEPMLRRALEGASFVTAFDRNAITRTLGVRPPERFDEAAARDVALKQGLGVVVSGVVERQGSGYGVSVKASQAVTGDVITTAKARASSKEQVLGQATRLVTSVRKALGDRTSESDQLFALHSVTATSLDVVRDYAAAVDASANNRFEEALQHASRAVQIDPKFGLGYQLLAVYSRNLGRLQDAGKFASQGLQYLDGMTERERYATRGIYFRVTGDYQKCVEQYNELIVRYPADVLGRNQVALCSSKLRDLRRAVDEMRHIVELLPKRALFRDNLALYANYAGDFQTGEREARAVQGPDTYGSLALAFAQVGQGQLAQAKQTYEKLRSIDALGASFAASGLADLAIIEGRYSEAARVLDAGVAAELASKNTDRAASKLVALAHVRLLQNQKAMAVAAAERALMNGSDVKIRFMAGRTFIEAGQAAKARTLVTGLDAELQPEPRAYAKLLEGEIALKEARPRDAIKSFSDANAMFDTWLGNFDLGRAYFEAGAIPQADSQFDRSVKRRGEALSLFLDEEATYGFFPEVLYYQGRVREAMNNGRFAESYRQYLDLRGAANEDLLLPEVRRRAGAR